MTTRGGVGGLNNLRRVEDVHIDSFVLYNSINSQFKWKVRLAGCVTTCKLTFESVQLVSVNTEETNRKEIPTVRVLNHPEIVFAPKRNVKILRFYTRHFTAQIHCYPN